MQRDGMSARVARGALLAALFAAYPLALVRPVHTGSSLVFYLILPVFFWFSLICLAWLLTTPAGGVGTAAAPGPAAWRGRLPALLTLGLVAWVAGDAFVHPGATLFDTVAALGAFAVPAWVALAPRHCLPRRLPLVLALVWTAGALHGLWQTRVGFEVVGLAGNRNWMASTMLALLPWVWLALTPRQPSGTLGENLLRKGCSPNPFPNLFASLVAESAGSSRLKQRRFRWWGCLRIPQPAQKVSEGGLGENPFQRVSPKGARLVAGLMAVGVGGFLAWRAESRAAWLALAGYGLVFGVLPRFSWPGRGLLLLGLAGVLAAGAVAWPERVAQAVGDDIRLPLWAQTARLVKDHPVGGCGPGLFRREFVAYKSAEQMERRVAATITEHPHNEPLNLAATLGLPAAVLWLALWWPLVRRPRGGWLAAAHFTAWMIFCQAWFDKTLVQPPTQVAGYLCLGLLWRPWLACRLQPARRPPVLRLAWGV
ncbi:MAG: O-antigen ligase family protein, partial [Lentisphaeria bacterium]